MSFTLNVNGKRHTVDVPGEMPLLWAVREIIGLTGTKFGCGVGVCGACTVLVDGAAERSCTLQVSDIGDRQVTTIEQLGAEALHPIQQSWIEHNIPQCGYCQPGFIMAAVDLLTNQPDMSDEQVAASLTNICRCGTYPRMGAAIAEAREQMKAKGTVG